MCDKLILYTFESGWGGGNMQNITSAASSACVRFCGTQVKFKLNIRYFAFVLGKSSEKCSEIVFLRYILGQLIVYFKGI